MDMRCLAAMIAAMIWIVAWTKLHKVYKHQESENQPEGAGCFIVFADVGWLVLGGSVMLWLVENMHWGK